MRLIILLFFSFSTLAFTCTRADCDKYMTPVEKMKEADIVFYAEVLEAVPEASSIRIKLNALRSWKGILKDPVMLHIDNPDFFRKEILEGTFYLVYANQIDGKLMITTCFTLVEWELAEKEMEDLDSNFDCIDESKVNKQAICTMEYAPVCGCDNKTYGNACQAKNAGMRTWVDGECY